jgi:hypothetical protein
MNSRELKGLLFPCFFQVGILFATPPSASPNGSLIPGLPFRDDLSGEP